MEFGKGLDVLRRTMAMAAATGTLALVAAAGGCSSNPDTPPSSPSQTGNANICNDRQVGANDPSCSALGDDHDNLATTRMTI